MVNFLWGYKPVAACALQVIPVRALNRQRSTLVRLGNIHHSVTASATPVLQDIIVPTPLIAQFRARWGSIPRAAGPPARRALQGMNALTPQLAQRCVPEVVIALGQRSAAFRVVLDICVQRGPLTRPHQEPNVL